MEEKDIKEGKPVAWMSYVSVLFLVPLLSQKENPYCKFHVKQGIVLFIVSFIWAAASGVLAWLPVVGMLTIQIGWLLLLVLSIIGIVNALSGKTEKLPLIGQYAEKLNF